MGNSCRCPSLSFWTAWPCFRRTQGLRTKQGDHAGHAPMSAHGGSSNNLTNPTELEISWCANGPREDLFITPMAQGWSTQIISMIQWIRTSRLSVKKSLSL